MSDENRVGDVDPVTGYVRSASELPVICTAYLIITVITL